MTDKTIRYTIDDKGVSQANSKIRQSYEDLNKDLTHMSASQRKLGKDEIKDIQDKIKLLKQKNDLEEAALRKRIQDKQLEIQLAEKDLALWKARRVDDASKVSTAGRGKFVAETTREENRRRSALTEERVSVLDDRAQYADIRDKNKKQISELQNISHTLNRNTDKTIRSTEGIFSNIFRGSASGSASGFASMLLGGAGAAALVAGTAIAVTKSYQDGLKKYSSIMASPLSNSMWAGLSARDIGLGVSGTEVLNKKAAFSVSAGRKLSDDETKAYMGVTMSRGISDQQISQLLNISRYSNRSPLGTKEDFESYINKTGKSLVRLPEILETYLRVSNEILNRTGRVDARGVQQSIMSVGNSYGVSGLQLDRTMSGLTQLSTLSDNPVLLSIQQQAFRKLYPGKGPIDMLKALQNPTEDPKLMEEIRGRMSRFGGGGVYGTLGMTSLLGGDVYTAERLMKSGIKVEPKGEAVTRAKEVELEHKNYEIGKDFAGSIAQMETALGYIKDNTALIVSSMIDIFKEHGVVERANTRAIETGTSNALRKNPR